MREYPERDLKKIIGDFGKRYLIEFADLIQDDMYLGNILSEPEMIYKDNEISKIKFDDELHTELHRPYPLVSGNKDIVQFSFELKKRLRTKLKELKTRADDNNPDAEQAYIILSNFEERWVESDNISSGDDGPFLIQWGIEPSKMGPVIPYEPFQSKPEVVKPIIEPIGKKNQIPFIPFLLAILFFLLSLTLPGLLSDDIDKLKVSHLENIKKITNQGTKRIKISTLSAEIIDLKNSKLLSDVKYKITRAIDNTIIHSGNSLNGKIIAKLDGGRYIVSLKKKSYYPVEGYLLLAKDGATINEKFKMRKKGILKRIVDSIRGKS